MINPKLDYAILCALEKQSPAPLPLIKEFAAAHYDLFGDKTLRAHLDRLEKVNFVSREMDEKETVRYALSRRGRDLAMPMLHKINALRPVHLKAEAG